MKASEAMLVMFSDRDIGHGVDEQDLRRRAVAGYSKPDSTGAYEHMAAVEPLPAEEEVFKNAKEIK